MGSVARDRKSRDSLAMDISALAISGGSSSSERTKLDRDLFVEGFGSGKKRVLVHGSSRVKDAEESAGSSPPEGWRSWMVGGRSLGLVGVVAGVIVVAGGWVGGAGVVAEVVVVVVVGGGEVVEVICLSWSSSSLAVVVVTMFGSGRPQ